MTHIITTNAHAHDEPALATYLGNEGVMITSDNLKIVFDPFFHNSYNTYQLVPEKIRTALFNNQPPYDNIDAIFISHAHGDHFSADDMLMFLKNNKTSQVIAPKQAVTALMALPESASIKNQVTAIEMAFGDQPTIINMDNILIEAVRIPHAGWPGRSDIENLVFRVTLDQKVTVMHMGDADPNDNHYTPFKSHWQKKTTNTAYPPYWFFDSHEGNYILSNRINAQSAIGIHVPTKVPSSLKSSGHAYFSQPGEHKIIHHTHQ